MRAPPAATVWGVSEWRMGVGMAADISVPAGLLERHRAFWERASVERPLIGKEPPRQWTKRPYPVKGRGCVEDPTPILSRDVDVERLIGADDADRELLLGDLILPAGCLYPEAWMGSLIGCPIRASAYGCVARPAQVGLAAASTGFSVETALWSDWAAVMDCVLRTAADLFGERLPVRQLHQRGVIDMLAAFLGEVELCTAASDRADELRQLADQFADLYTAVVRRGLALRPVWRDGYVSVWNVYAPGPIVDYQVDASSLFSPRMYEELFLVHDRKVLREFPYSVIHLHACGLHILDGLLKMDELSAVQIQLDRETGVWEKEGMLACCRRVQEASKCLIINGELAENELAEFLSALSPNGLAVRYWEPTRRHEW